MHNNPLISVIIPVYNTENYLKTCLDSVVNQTYNNLEIICINDCSEDNSLIILDDFAKNDKRIKIINFLNNKGVAYARNYAIKLAKGKFIGFVDSDDWIDADFYEKLSSQLEKSGNNYAQSYVVKQFESKGFKSKYLYFPTALYKKAFLNKNKIEFTEGCICGEDQLFVLKARFLCTPDFVSTNYYYRRHDKSNCYAHYKTPEKLKSDLYAFGLCLKFLENNKINKNYNKFLNEYLTNIYSYSKRVKRVNYDIYFGFLKSITADEGNLDSLNRKLYNAVKEHESDKFLYIIDKYEKQALFAKLRADLRNTE